MKPVPVLEWSNLIPKEEDIFKKQIRWIDISEAPLLISLGKHNYCIKWMNSSVLSPSVINYLQKGVDSGGKRWVARGISKGAELLKKNLSGKKSQIIISIDFDILRDISFNGELESFFSLLFNQPWKYIFFSETPYLQSFGKILQDMDKKISSRKGRTSCRGSTPNLVEIFFTGFYQPMEKVLEPFYKLNGNIRGRYKENHSFYINRKQESTLPKLAKTGSILSRYGSIKVNFLIDVPVDDVIGGSMSRQHFSSLISRSFLREQLGSDVDIYFSDESSLQKFPQLVLWLENRGHKVKVLSRN